MWQDLKFCVSVCLNVKVKGLVFLFCFVSGVFLWLSLVFVILPGLFLSQLFPGLHLNVRKYFTQITPFFLFAQDAPPPVMNTSLADAGLMDKLAEFLKLVRNSSFTRTVSQTIDNCLHHTGLTATLVYRKLNSEQKDHVYCEFFIQNFLLATGTCLGFVGSVSFPEKHFKTMSCHSASDCPLQVCLFRMCLGHLMVTLDKISVRL